MDIYNQELITWKEARQRVDVDRPYPDAEMLPRIFPGSVQVNKQSIKQTKVSNILSLALPFSPSLSL